MAEKPTKGVLFFSDREPHITGYLVIGNEHFELVGWHSTKIRADLSVKKTGERQEDLFDGDRSGEGG
ncbi:MULTISPECIES: hypothetical protein [unclassified Bradyrhizobium]|uniref:hypothetical protein n=1 Tax=unclassified Bradyrhizobium TaxID=2631580 RepID=UPI002FEFE373